MCSLPGVGGVATLLDCGWDVSLDPEPLAPLKAVIDKIDLVLISRANLEHLGDLPYAVASWV